MKSFREFVSEISPDVTILQRIVGNHGTRFRLLLKDLILSGELDDDPELLADLRELMKSIKKDSAYPITNRKKEPEFIYRPEADGSHAPDEPASDD